MTLTWASHRLSCLVVGSKQGRVMPFLFQIRIICPCLFINDYSGEQNTFLRCNSIANHRQVFLLGLGSLVGNWFVNIIILFMKRSLSEKRNKPLDTKTSRADIPASWPGNRKETSHEIYARPRFVLKKTYGKSALLAYISKDINSSRLWRTFGLLADKFCGFWARETSFKAAITATLFSSNTITQNKYTNTLQNIKIKKTKSVKWIGNIIYLRC